MKRWLILLLSAMIASCTLTNDPPVIQSSSTEVRETPSPTTFVDETQFFTSLDAIQSVAPFPILVPDPSTLAGRTFQEAQLIPDAQRPSVALIYTTRETEDNRRELTIQQVALPSALQPPTQPHTSQTVCGHVAYLVATPVESDLHALIWEENGSMVSVSGDASADELLDIANGLTVLE